MTYNEFIDLMVDRLGEVYPDSTIEKVVANKNNGVVFRGVNIRGVEENCSPNIYLENIFEKYEEDNDFEYALNYVKNAYESAKISGLTSMEYYIDYNQVCDNILFKLINKEYNEELLKDVPYIDYLDLAIVFYYKFPEGFNNISTASILIRNQHMHRWGVGTNDLFKAAMENTPRVLGFSVKGILDTVCDMVSDENVPNELMEKKSDLEPVLVATNNHMYYGAAVILYKDALKTLATKINGDLYVIPSSIHEVIMFDSNSVNEEFIEHIRGMISLINETQVKREDVLSNNLYLYSKDENSLKIVS
ncbi:MAG: DUF5688 family protein [Pseudobutyrivibrio sp.]|nr:DUF5688 family protein [Pseudobutyrivibrio sp.]